jgi:hypothetical protein
VRTGSRPAPCLIPMAHGRARRSLIDDSGGRRPSLLDLVVQQLHSWEDAAGRDGNAESAPAC